MVEMTRPRAKFNADLVAEDLALRGWTASELAKRSGMSIPTVTLFLRGEVQTTKTAHRIAKALGKSVRRYFAGIDRSAA